MSVDGSESDVEDVSNVEEVTTGYRAEMSNWGESMKCVLDEPKAWVEVKEEMFHLLLDMMDMRDRTEVRVSIAETAVEAYKVLQELEECNRTIKMVRELMDSAASKSMSGVSGRLTGEEVSDTQIVGFDSSLQPAGTVGTNCDGKEEMYVPGMPDNLALLCANDYARSGAVILTETEGIVLPLSEIEKVRLADFITSVRKSPDVLYLEVRNRVYEVVRETRELVSEEGLRVETCDRGETYVSEATCESDSSITEELEREQRDYEIAFRVDTYFNSVVNYSTVDQKITGMIFTGFSVEDLRDNCKFKLWDGMDPSISLESLAKYESLHGKVPHLVQTSYFQKGGLRKAFEGTKMKVTKCGQVVQMDVFFSDYNTKGSETKQIVRVNGIDVLEQPNLRKKVEKLLTLGGAVAAHLEIDKYSKFYTGHLLTTLGRPEDSVRRVFEDYALCGYKIGTVSADTGIVPAPMYMTFTGPVLILLREKQAWYHRAENNNHAIGGEDIENGVKQVRRLMRVAFAYVLQNPNVALLGWQHEELLRLWGEVFLWSLVVINLRKCKNVPEKTRYEVFMQRRFNMQRVRLLPIFSVVLVWRYVINKEGQTNREGWQKALYVGPESVHPGKEPTSGNARFATRRERKDGKVDFKIVVTSKIKNVTDGGDLDLNAVIDQGTRFMINAGECATVSTNGVLQPPMVTASGGGAYNLEEEDQYVDQYVQPTLGTVSEIECGVKKCVFSDMADVKEFEYNDPSVMIGENLETSIKTSDKRGVVERRKSALSEEVESEPVEVPLLPASVPPKRGGMRVRVESEPTVKRNGKNSVSRPISEEFYRKRKQIKARTPNSKAKKKVNREQRGEDAYKRYYGVPSTGLSREERAKKLVLAKEEQRASAEAYYACDWSTYEDGMYMLDMDTKEFIRISSEMCTELQKERIAEGLEEGYAALTVGVPKTWSSVLESPVWRVPGLTEWDNIAKRTIVRVDQEIARAAVRNGADVVTLFPVFEVKEKEGKTVYKVRLVGDGRTHYSAGATYSSTPSREEFLMFVHMVAHGDLEWCHIDEIRAFLNSDRIDKCDLYTRLRGEQELWKVDGALYGLKTSPHDYQVLASQRLLSMGFERKEMCNCIFVKWVNGVKILVYVYVDDYFWASSDRESLEEAVKTFRASVECTEPNYDPLKGLGMEFERRRAYRIILVTMVKSITNLAMEWLSEEERARKVMIPIPATQFLVNEKDYEKAGVSEEDKEMLSRKDQLNYLKMTGSILWIHGVRWDTSFATMYCTWWTHAPRGHHTKIVKRLIQYLWTTVNIPLVLGGIDPVEIICVTDSSLGTGVKARSVNANVNRLGRESGAVSASSKASDTVRLSSCEDELGGLVTAVKSARRIRNILDEMECTYAPIATVICDNEKTIGFVRGENGGDGMKHAERKLYYMKEEVRKGDINVIWESGKTIAADPMTKPKSEVEQRIHIIDIQGLKLLEELPAVLAG